MDGFSDDGIRYQGDGLFVDVVRVFWHFAKYWLCLTSSQTVDGMRGRRWQGQALKSYRNPPGRNSILYLMNQATYSIVLDTIRKVIFNANPSASIIVILDPLVHSIFESQSSGVTLRDPINSNMSHDKSFLILKT